MSKATFLGELIIQRVEWRGNALKRPPWYSGRRSPKGWCLKPGEVGRELPKHGVMLMWKAAQRWVVRPICRGSIKYLWWVCRNWLTNLWSKGSKRSSTEMCHLTNLWGKCGGVKAFTMKHHTPLQAASSLQAQSRHLRVYAQIGLSERRKSWALPIRSVAVETYKPLNLWWKWCHSTCEAVITSRGGIGTSRWKSQ